MAKNNALDEYLNLCAKFCNIDIDIARKETLAAIKRHDKKPYNIGDSVEMTRMEKKWYDSLAIDSKNPEYTVYADPYYFCETWLCWVKYSKRYLRDIHSPRYMFGKSIVESMVDVGSVLDLGCGAGYTTAELKRIFPNADVYGTNFEDSSQYAMSSYIGDGNGFKMRDSHRGIKADLIFASEYFEHIQAPIEHLFEVLTDCEPKYLLFANTFNSNAIGHFNVYLLAGNAISRNEVSREFSAKLTAHGYEQVPTRCWNNRPAFWRRVDEKGRREIMT